MRLTGNIKGWVLRRVMEWKGMGFSGLDMIS